MLRHAGFQAIAWRTGGKTPLPLAVGDTRLSPELQQALWRDPARGTRPDQPLGPDCGGHHVLV
ncbi:hypothetical protein LP420_35765 [Massilia sp. B-10]|nr:hypothetical protein LP420_35765 [Massilia sp. B-10]